MSRIRRISYAITPEGRRANATKQAVDLRDKVLSIVDSSNFSTSTARKITKKAAFSVVMRSLEESKGLPLSLREHLAMKELNNYIALAKYNKSDFFYATNTDLLPISHPRSTREHSMTASALRISRSRWFAADPRITDERAKAVLASAFESVPGSVEHLYYTSILLSLPQGIVPGDALIAATDGNSFESRSARARRQRRDRKGQFAYEGGGIRALIRRLNGEIFSISGRVVANAKNSRDVEVEFPDGKIAQVNPVKGEYIKAVLPTPDGYSPKPIVPSVSDEVINEKDLVFLDAPNGWVKDETFKDFGDKVERYVDSNKEFVVFVHKKDDGTKDYQILNAKSAERIDIVNTWAEVQDRLEGKEDQILNQKAELPKQQAAPVETKGGFEYNYPDKAYKIRPDSEYDVQGRVDEESPDFTDDPVELAQKQDERDLLTALEQAVSPGENGENALGVGALPFRKGDEFVPAEAIFFALQEAGADAPMELAKIYDKNLGNNANEKALNDFRKKEEVVSGNTPELAESFKKVTEQNPDLEVPTDAPKFDAKEAESAPLPALLEGLSEKELEQFMETKDHIPYLPKNEEIEMPEGYNPLSPEPFAAWKEVTAENPDAILPEGFSDNPVYLAQEIPTNDLLKELRRSVEPGNEVPGAAVIALPTEDGEDFVANVPGEAVRDALQLKGIDTNAELKKIADEGFVGQKDEPIAELPEEPVAELPLDAPVEKKPMNAFERLMAENKAAADAVEERVAKLKKDAEDRVDEQGRSVPEGWGVIAKNRPNFGRLDTPNNYFNVYGNNNFEASIDADGKITVKDRNGLLPDKSYDNWEDLQADLANQKSEYSSLARERVREIAKKYGYSDEQIAAFDSMSQQELADFFANPENHTKAYAEALDDFLNSSAVDLPSPQQKARWSQIGKDEKILAQAGDAPSEKAPEAAVPDIEKPDISEPPVQEEAVAAIDVNSPNLKEEIQSAIDKGQKIAFSYNGKNRIVLPKSIWTNPKNGNVNLRAIEDGPDGGQKVFTLDKMEMAEGSITPPPPPPAEAKIEELSEGDKAVLKNNAFVEENAGTLQPTEARNLKVGDFLWAPFFGRYEEILAMEPADMGRIKFTVFNVYNNKEETRYFEMDSPLRNVRRPGIEDQAEPITPAKAAPRGGKRGLIKRAPLSDQVRAKEGRPIAMQKEEEGLFKDKNGVAVKPGDVVVHPKHPEWGRGVVKLRIGAQVVEGKKAGGQVRAGKVQPNKLVVQFEGDTPEWVLKNAGRELKAGNIELFEGNYDDLVLDPRFRGGAMIPNAPANPGEVSLEGNEFDGLWHIAHVNVRRPYPGRPKQISNQEIMDINGGMFQLNLIKIGDMYEGALLNPGIRIQIVARDRDERIVKKALKDAGAHIEQAANGAEAMDDGVIPNLDKVEQPQAPAAPDAIADDKFAVPLMEPVVRKDKDKDLQEQIRRAIDAGDEVSFNYNGKTRYVKPVKIWKNPVNDNINVTAIEDGEIKNFTISKMGYIEDPEGAALERPEPLNVVFELDNDNIKNGLEEVRKGIKKLKGGKDITLKNAEAALDNFVGKLDVKDHRGMDISELDALLRRLERQGGADDLIAAVKQLKNIVEPEKQRLELDFERKMFDEINNPLEAVVADAKTINAANVKEVIDEIVKRLPDDGDGAAYRLNIVRRHLLSYAKDISTDDDIIDADISSITEAISYLEGLPVDVSGIKKQLEELKKSVKGYAKNNKKPFGKANMPFIDPIALQEKRVADGVNKFDLANAQNLKALVANDQFFVDNAFAAPYKDDLQKFFAQDGEVPLASLSVDARQALSQIVSSEIRNPGAGSAEAKKARANEYARMALGLHEEKLAFNPNRDDLGPVGEQLKDIDFAAVFKAGQRLNTDKQVELEINGQPTGFKIQRVGTGINASYNYRLIDIASGQIFYFKREKTLETADAEYASNQLARALKIAGVPVVVKHNNDALVLIMTNAGDSLDFEKDPTVAGQAGQDYRDAASRGTIADLTAFGILDAVILNTDRHTGNFLLGGVDRGNVDGNGREEIQILPIDHGFAQLFRKNYMINGPLEYMTNGDGGSGGRINSAFAQSIGAVTYKELIDMTIQQAIQAIERGDYLSDVKPADKQAIIDRLLVLKGIDVDKWKSKLTKKL